MTHGCCPGRRWAPTGGTPGASSASTSSRRSSNSSSPHHRQVFGKKVFGSTVFGNKVLGTKFWEQSFGNKVLGLSFRNKVLGTKLSRKIKKNSMQSTEWTRGKFVGKILLFFTSVLIPNVVCICNFVFCNFKKCHRTTSPGWPWTRWLTTPRSSAKYFRSPTGIRSASAVLQIPYRYTIHSAVLKYKIFFSFNVLASGELIQHNLYFTVPVKHHYCLNRNWTIP